MTAPSRRPVNYEHVVANLEKRAKALGPKLSPTLHEVLSWARAAVDAEAKGQLSMYNAAACVRVVEGPLREAEREAGAKSTNAELDAEEAARAPRPTPEPTTAAARDFVAEAIALKERVLEAKSPLEIAAVDRSMRELKEAGAPEDLRAELDRFTRLVRG